jgi:hypothetical protein
VPRTTATAVPSLIDDVSAARWLSRFKDDEI